MSKGKKLRKANRWRLRLLAGHLLFAVLIVGFASSTASAASFASRRSSAAAHPVGYSPNVMAADTASDAHPTAPSAEPRDVPNSGPPKAETVASDQITSGSARLNAVVSSFGAEVLFCTFEYGLAPSLEQSAPCAGPPASFAGAPVSAVIFGLAPSTEYSFRISFTTIWSASGAGGTESGTATGAAVKLMTLSGSEVPSGPGSTPTFPQSPPPSSQVSVGPSPQPAAESRSRILCAGVGDPRLRIPTGYVTVAFLHAQQGCGADRYGYGFNAEEIQKAANGVDACVGNGINPGIPNGFVVTKMWHKPNCGNDRFPSGFNADEIHLAVNGVDACVGNGINPGIPDGFVVTKMWHKPGCGNDRFPYGFNADEIHEATNGVDACVGNGINPGIPNGFVVTKMWHKPNCGNDRFPYGFNADEIHLAVNGVDACVGNNISNPGIPSGFIVTKIWHKPGCGNDRFPYGFNADEIHEATNGVDACVGYNITNRIPNGFVVIRRVTKPGCGPATRGYNALEIGVA